MTAERHGVRPAAVAYAVLFAFADADLPKFDDALDPTPTEQRLAGNVALTLSRGQVDDWDYDYAEVARLLARDLRQTADPDDDLSRLVADALDRIGESLDEVL